MSREEPEAEEAAEPVIEAKAEPVMEAKAEPVIEAKEEPVLEAEAEPVMEAKAEPVIEAKAEPAPELEAKAEAAPVDEETSNLRRVLRTLLFETRVRNSITNRYNNVNLSGMFIVYTLLNLTFLRTLRREAK